MHSGAMTSLGINLSYGLIYGARMAIAMILCGSLLSEVRFHEGTVVACGELLCVGKLC